MCGGIIGVWRILDMEFTKSDEDVLNDILQETDFQPEAHGYYLFEILQGMFCNVYMNVSNELLCF